MRSNVLLTAINQYGTFEWKQGDNPLIMKWHHAIDAWPKNDEVPWCSSFAYAIAREAGFHPKSITHAAKSWLKLPNVVNEQDVQPGDVVVFHRGSQSWQGHVAFFVGWHGNYMAVIGGNQENSVKVSHYHKNKLAGIRRL